MAPTPQQGWYLESSAGLQLVRCAALNGIAGVAHGFSTRLDGDGEAFDLGRHDETDPAVVGRRRRLIAALGLAGEGPAVLEQVHGARVVSANEVGRSVLPPQADGVYEIRGQLSGVVPAVRTADCVPVLLADSAGRAVAAVHAGWRGTAAGVTGRAVRALAARGLLPRHLRAALGPSIGACCYEVGEEVLRAVARASGVSSADLAPRPRRLDLALANRRQLEAAGLPPSAVHAAPWCTRCQGGLFFSYRREGGPTGSLMACIGWTAGGP